MPQITQLDNDPTPNNNDLLVTVDVGAGTTKNISREQFFTGAPLPADTVDEQAIDFTSLTSVDANGWTVINGGKKLFIKKQSITDTTTVNSLAPSSTTSSIPLPVGFTSSTVAPLSCISTSNTFIPHEFSVSGSNVNIRLRNVTGASLAPGTVTVTVQLIEI